MDRESREEYARATGRKAPPYDGLYRYLGRVQLRIGDGNGAVGSFLQEREFHPLNVALYDDLGRAYLAAGRLPQAAISFLEGQFLKEGAKDMSTTVAVYRMLDPGGCAIVQRNGQDDLNYQCPLVLQHTCAAFGDLVKTLRESGMDGVADSAGREARERYGCR